MVARETSPLSSSSLRHFINFLTCSSLWFRKLRRVCSACLNADKRLKAQLVGSSPEVEEDTKSDISDIPSQRTGSVLSGREESDTGGLDAADARSASQPGTLCCVLGQDTLLSQCLSSQVYKLAPSNLMVRVTLRWTSILSGRGRGEKYS